MRYTKGVNRKYVLIYIFIVLVLLSVGVYLLKTNSAFITLPHYSLPTVSLTQKKPIATNSAEFAIVERVIDGDTIELTDGRRVRYIGIDTPELHHPKKSVQCFAQKAMEKNTELVLGKKILMKRDVSETDKYKRLLRYVWLVTTNSKQTVFVNEFLVREGYAHLDTFPPDVSYVELFKNAADEARLQNKGLWKECQ